MLRAVPLFFLFIGFLPNAGAQSQCLEIFSTRPPLGTLAPVPQLFLWEQTANLPEMQKPTVPVKVNIVLAPQIFVETSKMNDAPTTLDFFDEKSFVAWPQHPLNSDAQVPFFFDAPSQTYSMNYSASRSLFLFFGADLYSVKAPTDRPNPLGALQPTKAQVSDPANLSVLRSQAIKDVDGQLGESAHLQVLYDVAAYTERGSGSGFVVRDLRPLQDGNYYLPGFSIPYVGKEIFSRFKDGGSFEDFWGTHYAAAVGRAKAELLLRYGLLMSTPNAQNILVQLDKKFLPTGKIFIRDITDSQYYETVAYSLGFESQARNDNSSGIPLVHLLQIQTSTSFWKMDAAGISNSVIKKWEALHDQAFVARIVAELKLSPEKYQTLYDIQSFFATDGGAAILRDYKYSSLK